MIADDDFWDVLAHIKQGVLVPIVGPEIVRHETLARPRRPAEITLATDQRVSHGARRASQVTSNDDHPHEEEAEDYALHQAKKLRRSVFNSC